MIRDDYDDWHMHLSELDEYVEKVARARSDHPQLPIRLALEVDYLPGHETWIRDLANRHPWDYFIGSVHYVSETWDMDNPKKIDQWRSSDTYDVWAGYFDWLTRAASSGLFDIIGHADLCKKFGFYPDRDCTGLFERFLDAAQKADVSIETNTAGLRKDCREMYPSPQFLELAHTRQIPLTFGSDAHAPDAVKLARITGYTHCCRYIRRERSAVKI